MSEGTSTTYSHMSMSSRDSKSGSKCSGLSLNSESEESFAVRSASSAIVPTDGCDNWSGGGRFLMLAMAVIIA